PVSEGLYLFLLLLALLVWSRRLEHPLAVPVPQPGGMRGGRRWALLLGLLLGALCLTRAEGMLVAALLVGVGLVGSLGKRTLPERTPLHRWALVALGWVLVVGPWTLRNFVEIRAFEARQAGRLAEPLPKLVPVTIYGPLNLASPIGTVRTAPSLAASSLRAHRLRPWTSPIPSTSASFSMATPWRRTGFSGIPETTSAWWGRSGRSTCAPGSSAGPSGTGPAVSPASACRSTSSFPKRSPPASSRG